MKAQEFDSSEQSLILQFYRAVIDEDQIALDNLKNRRWSELNTEVLSGVFTSSEDWPLLVDFLYETSSYGENILHTPLSLAVSRNNFPIVKILLRDFQLNPNLPLTSYSITLDSDLEDEEYFEDADLSPLEIAINRRYDDIIELLLDYGADPNELWANVADISCNDREVDWQVKTIYQLIRYGAHVRTAVYDYLMGMSLDLENFEIALSDGSLSGLDRVFYTLKNVGATLSSNEIGITAVHLAVAHPVLLRRLGKYFPIGPEIEGTVPAIFFGHICPVTMIELSRAGHDLKATDFEGTTLLHRWVLQNNHIYEFTNLNSDSLRALPVILDGGVAVDAGNDFGNTPLHLACLTKNLETVRLLIDAGANPNIKNLCGETPIFYAFVFWGIPVTSYYSPEEFSYPDFDDADQASIVSLLRMKGADFSVCSKSGLSPTLLSSKDNKTLTFKNSRKIIGGRFYHYGFKCIDLDEIPKPLKPH